MRVTGRKCNFAFRQIRDYYKTKLMPEEDGRADQHNRKEGSRYRYQYN
jgi:hypothetical protein